MTGFGRIRQFWRSASLVQRFALAGSLVMVANLGILGSFVAGRIERGVMRQASENTAHYLEGIISPLSQELARADALSPGPTRALEELLASPPIRSRIASFKIWKGSGLVVWATDRALIGQTFEVDEDLTEAWAGRVVSAVGNLDKPESAGEAALDQPLIEVYSPIREAWTGRVIAVIEFYEYAGPLLSEVAAARRSSWLVVVAVTAATALALFGIVLRGNRTIEDQRRTLERQVSDLERLARQNRDLRLRVQRASSGAAETNEKYLSRIGADLHDGPAQLLSLAALRLDSLEAPRDEAARQEEIGEIRTALGTAMAEIRNISRGLSLPELAGRSVGQVIRRAVDIHRALTRTEVALDLPPPDPAQPDLTLPHPKLIALYRFVQEALSNATRHGGGQGMAVRVATGDGRLSVAVSDAGPGLPTPLPETRTGLGLRGLGERVESLGGSFRIDSAPGRGVTLTLTLDITEETALG